MIHTYRIYWIRYDNNKKLIPTSLFQRVLLCLNLIVVIYCFYASIISVISCNRNPPQSICGIKKTKACLFVRRCLDDDVSEKFRNYFSVLNGANTRNQNCLLRLPTIKKEYFRGSFKYMGAKLYNDLHTSIRKTQNFDELKSLVKSFYN